MSETKADKFQRLRDNRLPKAVHAIALIENLSGSAYTSTVNENQDLVRQLQDAVDAVAKAFGVTRQAELLSEPGSTPKPDTETSVSDDRVSHTFVADGGSTALSEIRWAHDAAKGGDHKLAANRLKRILDAVNSAGT